MLHLNSASSGSGLSYNGRSEATVEAATSSLSPSLSSEVQGLYEAIRSLDELEKEREKLTNINARQESRIDRLQSKVNQLIGFYLVFQGVILTAIAQGSFLRCHNWWLPFSLSFIAAVAIILMVLHILLMRARCKLELEINRVETEKLNHRIMAKKRPARRSLRIEQEPQLEGTGHVDNWESKLVRSIYPTIVMVILFTFSFFMLIGCKRVLCSPGPLADGQ